MVDKLASAFLAAGCRHANAECAQFGSRRSVVQPGSHSKQTAFIKSESLKWGSKLGERLITLAHYQRRPMPR